MLLPRPKTHFYKYIFKPDLINHFYIEGRKWEIQHYFGNVTSISMCTIAGVKKYKLIISIDRYIFMKRTLIVSKINLINIEWIRPFKFVRLPTKFSSMNTFAKREPANIENLQEQVKIFQTHLKSRWKGRWKLEHTLPISIDISTWFTKMLLLLPPHPHTNTLAFRLWKTIAAF